MISLDGLEEALLEVCTVGGKIVGLEGTPFGEEGAGG